MENSNRTEQSQEPNEPTAQLFARIPYALFEARERGAITPSMFLAMLWCYRWADWSTGSIEKMCAERLVWATDGESARRTFQEALHGLAEAGWIVSHCPRGGTRPYRVDICNYVALSGALKGQVLNPSEIKGWRKPKKHVRAGNRAPSAQGVRVDDGEHNGEPSAPTMRVKKEKDMRDSSRDFSPRDSPRKAVSEPPLIKPKKSQTAAPGYPPQTEEIVLRLKFNLQRCQNEHPGQPIPVTTLYQLRKSFLDETNAAGIGFPAAPALFERVLREFQSPAAATPPSQPEIIPPKFDKLNPRDRARAINAAKSHPHWKVYGRFETYVRRRFGHTLGKLSTQECVSAWRAAISGPEN